MASSSYNQTILVGVLLDIRAVCLPQSTPYVVNVLYQGVTYSISGWRRFKPPSVFAQLDLTIHSLASFLPPVGELLCDWNTLGFGRRMTSIVMLTCDF